MICSSSKNNIFQDAINHCRHPTKLYPIIKDITNRIEEYKNKNYEQIICMIYDICKNINQIGPLMVYDISAGLCRYYRIPIDKVYIIGGGPRKAIKLLNINKKLHKINNEIKYHYVTIDELVRAFDNSKYKLDKIMRNNRNGDDWESFICNWQKNVV